MMSPERWALISQLLEEVLELPPDARSAHLAAWCEGDAELRLEVERLVRAAEAAEGDSEFLSGPAAEFGASVFAEVEAEDLGGRLDEALAGRYRIEREVGRGGMARVFLAHDLRHGRSVALKVMNPGLLAGKGGERFLREIRISAALSHPHILPLHDSGEEAGLLYYMAPFVEGESLRERLLRQGPMEMDEAVRVLRDVASALDYAHRHGIVHRDIKPENILLQEGHAVVADFGIARAVGEALEAGESLKPGSLGTPAYTAPEQAAGQGVSDHRADLYALGVVAWEMLSGANPFVRNTPEESLAAHRSESPGRLAALRPDLPTEVTELVEQLLAKRPGDRPGSAALVLSRLTDLGGARSSRRGAGWTVAAAIVVLGAAAVAALRLRPPGQPWLALGHTTQVTVDPGLELLPALSPDGATVAYVAGPVDRMRLYVRPVAGGPARDLGIDCSPRNPKWSPDGTRILVHCVGSIQIWPWPSGPPDTVVSKPEIVFTGASWSPDGNRIVYGEGSVALRVLDLASGEDRQIAEGTDLHDPAWSHDGASIVVVAGNTGFNTGLYQNLGNLGPSRLLLVSAAGGALDTLTDSRFMHMSPVWAPDDRGLFLVSNRGGLRDIWFLPLDRHRRPAGEMRRLTTGLRAGSVALSGDGSRLAYGVYAPKTTIWSMSVSSTAPLTLAQATRLTTSVQDIAQVVVSPDGAWLAFDSDRSGNADIWKMAVAGGEPVQLTTDPGDDFMPDWSPDGRLIAYHSFRDGNRDLTVVSSAGGPARRITATPLHEFNPRWSPDGRRLVFYWRADERREGDRLINTLTRRDDSTWGGIEGVADQGYAPTWSPDGKWIAFADRPNEVEPRRGERSFRIRVVSAEGGGARVVQGEFDFEGRRLWVGPAAWGADGRELYFQGYDATGWGGLFSVPVSGGKPRLRLRQEAGELMHRGAPISVNRARAYFLLRTQESDVYVVDLGRNR